MSRRKTRLPGPAEQFRGTVRPAAAADLRAPPRRHRGGAAPGHRRLHRLHQGGRPRSSSSTRRRRSWSSPPRCSTSRPRGCCPPARCTTRRTSRCSRCATCCSPGCCSTGRSSTSRVMFAELEAAALRSYPRAVALEDRYEELLPEVMLGVDAERFAQIAATAFTPRPVPTVALEHLHSAGGVGARTGHAACWRCSRGAASGSGRRSPSWWLTATVPHRDRRAVPGAARTVPGQGGSIRASRTAWSAAGFVDRRPARQRTPGSARWKRRDS